MKLTIDIHDKHQMTVLRFIAGLDRDPAQGHPELALEDGDFRPAEKLSTSKLEYETRNGFRFELDHIKQDNDGNNEYWWGELCTTIGPVFVKYNESGHCLTGAFQSREWDIVA